MLNWKRKSNESRRIYWEAVLGMDRFWVFEHNLMPGCFIGVILKDGIIYKVNEKSPHFLLLNEVKRLMVMEYNRIE